MQMAQAAWVSRLYWRFRPVRTGSTWEVVCDAEGPATSLPAISTAINHLKELHALDVNYAPSIKQKNAGTTTLLEEDDVILANAASGNVILNLPPNSNRFKTIIRIDTTRANSVTIDPDGAATIDGETTLLLEEEESVIIVPNGSDWLIAASHLPRPHVVTVTGATTLDRTNHTVLADATAAAFTVTLPAVATVPIGHTYDIKKIAGNPSNQVTIDANGAETIDGSATIVLNIQYDIMTIRNGGTEWNII